MTVVRPDLSQPGASPEGPARTPTDPAALAAAYSACEAITRQRARNFYYGLRLTPPEKRGAMYAVYAWMRHADDLADADGLAAHERLRRIETLRERTRRLFAGELPADADRDPTWIAMADTVRRHHLAVAPFVDMLDGQREDVEGRTYETFEELRGFCYRVASTVGLVCIAIWGPSSSSSPLPIGEVAERSEAGEGPRVHGAARPALVRPFGPPSPEAGEGRRRALAIDRGIAFQLTNILRDVREDFERGRVYLPREDFERHGITPADLVGWREPARCEAFMREQLARTEAHYARSAPLDALVDPACRPTLWAMTRIYRGILGKIEASPCRIAGRRRIRLSSLTKALIAFRARRLATSAQRENAGIDRSGGIAGSSAPQSPASPGARAHESPAGPACATHGVFDASGALSQGVRR